MCWFVVFIRGHHTIQFGRSLIRYFFGYGVYKFLNIIQFDQYDKRNQCQISGKGQSKINQFNNIICRFWTLELSLFINVCLTVIFMRSDRNSRVFFPFQVLSLFLPIPRSGYRTFTSLPVCRI